MDKPPIAIHQCWLSTYITMLGGCPGKPMTPQGQLAPGAVHAAAVGGKIS